MGQCVAVAWGRGGGCEDEWLGGQWATVREMEWAALVRDRVGEGGSKLDELEVEALGRYLALLERWNARMNLTGFDLGAARAVAVDRLVVEPVQVALLIRSYDRKLIDIGSGSGSPAVPISITRPNINVVMVESRQRKAAFLREVVRHLRIRNARVESRRFEDVAADWPEDDSVDTISVRAVRADGRMWRAMARLLRSGGRVFWLGGNPDVGAFEEAGFQVLPSESRAAVVVLSKAGSADSHSR